MKKAVLTAMVCAAAFGVFAVEGPSPWVCFSSVGPDCYADGTTVQDGEIYALVWSKVGEDGNPVSEFAVTADGSVTDPANHKIVSRAPVATAGRCPPIAYVLRAEENYEGGVFGVYLFDTRTTDASGNVAVAQRNADGKTLACCNGYTPVEITVTAGGNCEVVKQATALSKTAAVATALPENVPTPTLTIKSVGNRFIVKADGLVPYVKYTVYNKATLTDTSKTLVEGVSGDTNGMTFDVGKEGNGAFFQVVPENR